MNRNTQQEKRRSDSSATTTELTEGALAQPGELSACHCAMCDDDSADQVDLLDLLGEQLQAAAPALCASRILWQVEDWADGCRLAFEAEGSDAVGC